VSSTLARFVAPLLVAAVVSGGCVGPTFIVQQYAGPQRPTETVAILRVSGAQPVRLVLLDEEDAAAPIVEDGRLHIELLPARHTVVVANAAAPDARYPRLTFDALAGKTYRVAFLGAEAHVYEVSPSSDAFVRDVTVLPSREAAPEPQTPAP
jgi:hypothetical protein